MKKIALLFVAILVFYQCKKEGWMVSEKELELLVACQENRVRDSLTIVNDLICDWELVGYGCSLCAPHKVPKAMIHIEQGVGELTIKEDGKEEEIIDFIWSLGSGQSSDSTVYYYFESDPFNHALQMYAFCEDYMFYDNRALDGAMYLYEKK